MHRMDFPRHWSMSNSQRPILRWQIMPLPLRRSVLQQHGQTVKLKTLRHLGSATAVQRAAIQTIPWKTLRERILKRIPMQRASRGTTAVGLVHLTMPAGDICQTILSKLSRGTRYNIIGGIYNLTMGSRSTVELPPIRAIPVTPQWSRTDGIGGPRAWVSFCFKSGIRFRQSFWYPRGRLVHNIYYRFLFDQTGAPVEGTYFASCGLNCLSQIVPGTCEGNF
ncbi:uncharacterized protein C8Q71DRAFT_353236 [Rhodofomes roseus]|uniref:Uncharacterized protein n=1 Tax=Rhodofomes roseus TaxID=34475 RepID=A0ABQ8KUE1_9APHY|nr:uncharacterized protein C8Q71DRAFT_353236 [Rhodofomes roseus]KAH9841902.1 hypothetical protein C8Q71DRAFT_353236 [Rhodofomes roseus]